jgi:hypothetical protein
MLRVRVAWTGPSSPLLSTHYLSPATEDASSALAAHIAVATLWNSVRAVISDAFTYTVQQQVDQLDLLGNLTGSFTVSNVASAIGQDAGDDLPYQNQGMIRWETGTFLDGRRLRGRTFIPGPTESASTGGAPTSAYLTALNTPAATYAGSSSNPVVWADHHDRVPPFGATGDITSGAARTSFAVLRSRR